MFRIPPLYRSPKVLVGWWKWPKGMPSPEAIEKAGAAATPTVSVPGGVEFSVVLVRESPLQPAIAMPHVRASGALRRAARRASLNRKVIRFPMRMVEQGCPSWDEGPTPAYRCDGSSRVPTRWRGHESFGGRSSGYKGRSRTADPGHVGVVSDIR